MILTTRRDCLRLSAALAAASLLPAGRARAARAGGRDVLVLVQLRGGVDGLNLVVPYGDPNYRRRRPNIGVPAPDTGEGSALPLDGFFGLHPALAPIHDLYVSGKLAAVHAVGMPTPSRSHGVCLEGIAQGMERSPSSERRGWLDRHLALSGGADAARAVSFGPGGCPALRGLSGGSVLAPEDRVDLAPGALDEDCAATLSELYARASGPFAVAARRALDAETADAMAPAKASTAGDVAVPYPRTRFGRQMRRIAALIRSDPALEVACVELSGWDQHERASAQSDALLDELARTLLAFDTDLGADMARVNVATVTEFGRSAAENGSQGTDHGSASAMLLLGGGVAGGVVYALWPGLADANLDRGGLDVTLDTRTVLGELLHKRMGNDRLDAVFPGFVPQPSIGAFRSGA